MSACNIFVLVCNVGPINEPLQKNSLIYDGFYMTVLENVIIVLDLRRLQFFAMDLHRWILGPLYIVTFYQNRQEMGHYIVMFSKYRH